MSVSSAPLRGHNDTVSTMAFNHDGSLLATGGLDGRALVWSAADGALQRTLAGGSFVHLVTPFDIHSSIHSVHSFGPFIRSIHSSIHAVHSLVHVITPPQVQPP